MTRDRKPGPFCLSPPLLPFGSRRFQRDDAGLLCIRKTGRFVERRTDRTEKGRYGGEEYENLWLSRGVDNL